jgi:hypothetical protein
VKPHSGRSARILWTPALQSWFSGHFRLLAKRKAVAASTDWSSNGSDSGMHVEAGQRRPARRLSEAEA